MAEPTTPAPPLEGYARYAIYWAPDPASALARTGAAWLGACPAGTPVAPAREPAGLPASRTALTERPRRYGLHATLKAPFRLAEGAAPWALDDALARLAADSAPAAAPRLVLDTSMGFVALRPAGPAPEVDALAAACVTALDAFRAPLTAAERAARGPEALDATETAHLDAWGYPYVLDRFRFHVTLTRGLPVDQAAQAAAALAPVFAPLLPEPFVLDALCLFGDPGGGAPFRLLRRHALGAQRSAAAR